MQVTETTKILDLVGFRDYMEQSSIEELKKGADAKYGSPWGLTIGQFFACSEGDFSHIGLNLKEPANITALQYYWVESFKDMEKQLAVSLECMTVPSTPEAKSASKACRPMTMKESILVFCRSYFGLKKFKEVESLTIDDLLLAKKDSYNTAIFEKTLADIQKLKHK